MTNFSLKDPLITACVSLLFLLPALRIQAQTEPVKVSTSVKMDKSKVQVVDVRTPGEFLRGRIDGAMNINFDSPTFAKELGSLDKSRVIVFYDAAGSKSAKAAQLAKSLGFQKIYDMNEGITAWRKEGKSLVK